MISRTVARRYARAVFELAEERGRHEEIGKQLRSVLDLIHGHAELDSVFGNPAVRQQSKRAIFDELEPSLNLDPLCANFLRLLIRKGRIHYLEAIIGEFGERLRELRGIVSARVSTASPLAAELKDELHRRLEEFSGKQVELEVSEEPDLIGGLVVRIGGTVYDGSIRQKLQRMRKSLVED